MSATEATPAVLETSETVAEARRQMENVLAQVALMAEYHSGFTEAVLAMGAKLDELIEK